MTPPDTGIRRDNMPALHRAIAKARHKAQHTITAVCALGCCQIYIFDGRETGSVGPINCPHTTITKKLHSAYRARMLARRRRRRHA